MRTWFHDHGLSLVAGGLWIALTVLAFALPDGSVQEYLHNLAGDAFGVTLVVVATKYLRERGSAESK